MTPIVLEAARADVLRQYDYFLRKDRPYLSERFIEAVELSMTTLHMTPGAGAPRSFAHPGLHFLRTWPVKGFEDMRIYYLHREDGIIILRVVHGKRDIETIMTDDLAS